MNLEIITNNVPRDLLYPYELSNKDWEDTCYDEKDRQRAEQEGDTFIKYNNHVYSLADFMRVEDNSPLKGVEDNSPLKGWHGYLSETFFSGILIKYCEDTSQVVLGRYYSCSCATASFTC